MSVVLHTKFDPESLEHSEFLSVEELGLLILADLHMVMPPPPPPKKKTGILFFKKKKNLKN
jgi:hypothetical protein